MAASADPQLADLTLADLTLDEIRLALAPDIADAAAFDGWNDAAIATAAAQAGLDPEVARLAYPGGTMDMIAAWIAHVDQEMNRAITPASLAEMPVRDRIRRLVTFRLDAVTGREEGLRRALAIMAMPQNLRHSLRLGWASANAMWRLAGDKATDFNHYTKRGILAGVYAATLAAWLDDESDGKADTLAFLDRRIDGIMRFEKAKLQILRPDQDHFSLARFLGRLRYPAR